MAISEAAEPLDLLQGLIALASRLGADAADAVLLKSSTLDAGCRLGEPEELTRAESRDLGLRVFVGARQANVSTTDISKGALAPLAERAIAMARAVPEDPYAGLADPARLARDWPSLDLADAGEPGPDELMERALAAEDAARAVAGVTNSEGAGAGWGRSEAMLVTSDGFAGGYASSRYSVSAAALAGEGTGMERDYWWSSAVHEADLEDPTAVGRRAGERAVRRLGARKARSGQVPVVYDTRISGGLLSRLAGAISGPSIARGTSFLKDALETAVFASGSTVVDDPHRARGLRSRPFDGEGVATERRAIVADGVLQTWLLDSRSARQLDLASTGHASRGTSGPPSPSCSNLWLEPGAESAEALIGGVTSGLYVTELIGMGVNMVTGDYSRGAAGFWIEQGEIAYPVSEVTVAGNLREMFRHLTPASDLEFRYGVDSPTVRIDGMTVAGR
ncbi:MAG: metallopeptidase TldD-related protein [Rhodospirillales bacterium]|nr:metallopeptidase TldD-related protein [Rhodospirillales bacterium]